MKAKGYVIETTEGFFGPTDAARTTFSVTQPRERAEVYKNRERANSVCWNLRDDFPSAEVREVEA